MKIIKQELRNLDKVAYFETHLMLLGAFLPVELFPREREVLGAFMSFEGDLAKVDRLGTSFRKQVKEKLGMSSGALTNHITALKDKGFIYTTLDGTLAIKDYLFPDDKEQGYQFIITKK